MLHIGGSGSGAWRWYVKQTVEVCRAISVGDLGGEGGRLCPGVWRRGELAWYRGDEKRASIGYEVDTTNAAALRYRLFYTFDDGESIDETGELVTTPCNFGGVRFWFECPGCGRRVGKLYRPPMASRYRCRKCHDLTYTSCQDSHRYDRLLGPYVAGFGVTPSELIKVMRGVK